MKIVTLIASVLVGAALLAGCSAKQQPAPAAPTESHEAHEHHDYKGESSMK